MSLDRPTASTLTAKLGCAALSTAQPGWGLPNPIDEPVAGPLRESGVAFVMKPHREAALTAERAAEERGVRVSQIVKCMVARSELGELVAALIPGDKTLKLRKVRRFVGGSPLALVNPQELIDVYDLTIGAISPVQLLGKARIFMDPTVLREELVDISSGDLCAGVELASKDLCDFVGAEIADIVSTRSRLTQYAAR